MTMSSIKIASSILTLASIIVTGSPACAKDSPRESQAQSGLRLLISIFNRLGSEPQLAHKGDMQQNQIALASDKDKDFQLSNTDPALAIRPQNKRIAVGRAILSKTTPEHTIAMAKPMPAAPKPVMLAKAGSAGSGNINNNPGASAELKEEGESLDRAPADKKKSAGIPYLAGSTRGMIMPMQDQNHIREFKSISESSYSPTSQMAAPSGLGAASADMRMADDAVIVRPSEQPGLFKYVREHKRELPVETPRAEPRESESQIASGLASQFEADAMKARTPASVSFSTAQSSVSQQANIPAPQPMKQVRRQAAKNEAARKDGSSADYARTRATVDASAGARGNYAPVIAFLPPSTVRGINGLALGARLSDCEKYFKARGAYERTETMGWQIFTSNKGKDAQLQAYVHNGTLEALRVYGENLLPPSIGVDINAPLSSMKNKFGEPSFILEEPGAAKKVSKNYVYPLSQLGFQLARPEAGGSPTVRSVLLFRYI